MFLREVHFKPTPLQIIKDPLLAQKGIELWLKRDDLTDPAIQGNKWRKLKYNLINAKHEGHNTLLTFGGAYSNHIYAVAAAGKRFGFKTIGIIRGEPACEPTTTLRYAAEQGMKLLYMNRAQYQLKEDPENIESLKVQLGNFYLLPEGGTNLLALQGCVELVHEIDIDYDHITVACGTGGTLAGIVAGMNGKRKAIGFSVLKGADTLSHRVATLVSDFCETTYTNWHINCDYHRGGYAQIDTALVTFIEYFKLHHLVQLEPVYTAKMLYGLYDLIQNDYFKRGSRIIAIHTGGLQGLNGYMEYFN